MLVFLLGAVVGAVVALGGVLAFAFFSDAPLPGQRLTKTPPTFTDDVDVLSTDSA